MQDVTMHDGHVRPVGKRVLEDGDELFVQFDGDDVASLRGQERGQRAQARSDLQHHIVGRELRRFHDAPKMGFGDEEVLAQALPWMQIVFS